MNNIQTVGNFALKNQQNPEIETQQNNVRKINFKADYQGQPRYTQPAILQQQPQQDYFSKMLEEQEKEQKKSKRKQNLSWGIGIASGVAIIAMVLMQLKTMKGGGVGGVEQAMAEAQKAIPIDVSKAPKLSELVLGKELKNSTDEIIVKLEKAYELLARGESSGVNLLLYGKPGGGKTQWTRTLAKELESRVPGSKFYELDPTKTGSIYKDGAEKNVQGFIENFIANAKGEPNVQHTLFIDEFDTFARKSTGPDEARNEKMQNVFKRIFEAMELPNTNIILATNKAEKGKSLTELLDEAIVNRIDDYVHVPLPNTEQMTLAFVNKVKKANSKLVNEKLLDEKNDVVKQLFDFVTDEAHDASFRDLNKIVRKMNNIATREGSVKKVLSEQELLDGIKNGEIKPCELKHLKEAVIRHAEGANWKIPDHIRNLTV